MMILSISLHSYVLFSMSRKKILKNRTDKRLGQNKIFGLVVGTNFLNILELKWMNLNI